ncbi:hypothetical protein OL383_004436 [Salmonella enterica]|nr:hypothetical protein [Salmonella enterica]
MIHAITLHIASIADSISAQALNRFPEHKGSFANIAESVEVAEVSPGLYAVQVLPMPYTLYLKLDTSKDFDDPANVLQLNYFAHCLLIGTLSYCDANQRKH